MKRLILIALLLLLIFGCEPAKNDGLISGHWYSCSKNGDYFEMHIKNNMYKYSSGLGVVSEWNEFKLKGDTLIQYDKFRFEDSIVINKATFYFTDKDELKLEYLTSDENWIFHRINEEVENIEDNLVLRDETIERSKARNCIDSRTKEQRSMDSLERVIDFQF